MAARERRKKMVTQDMQNNMEHIKDLLGRGCISISEANVMMVRAERVRLIQNSVPRDIRKYLNDAVKSGELCHMKKDGHKPECYFNPTFEFMANTARNRHEENVLNACKKIAGW